MDGEITGKRISRDRLKEILSVNIKLFQEEEGFLDYLTDLVIYLVIYEYHDSDKQTWHAGDANVNAGMNSGGIEKQDKLSTNVKKTCKVCQTYLKNGEKICPYCLSYAAA